MNTEDNKFYLNEQQVNEIYQSLLQNFKLGVLNREQLIALRTMLNDAQLFSCQLDNDDKLNKINIYNLIAYCILKVKLGDYDNDDEYYIELLNTIFQESNDVNLSKEELLKLLQNFNSINLSNELRKEIYEIWIDYYNLIELSKNKHENFSNEKMYYIFEKYNINYYNSDLINKINLNKINLVKYSPYINIIENKGKKI